ncbi:preprotein translocase subunit SecG [candidate division WOR-1 bacterium RIFCSPLOWO2_12_FULL_45_9]|uniref:Protein-export membrane protein SecG n=1 Tax=candidate division WOR-1 bacterium RIFCSPLOWO2_12_FULL_45_9 TaxID=1802568 RepID=A0A1F4RKU3_UNCSA|nr:MAG: preprotein translocase subunit SecG [candidate division WOR-1 bacterium RIFCSPLOWO2_12_FULL_45_9]
MRGLLLLLQIISAVALIISVLLHTAKGEGLGGIGGSAKIFGTPRGMEKGLDRVTWGCAIAFLSVSILLAILKI